MKAGAKEPVQEFFSIGDVCTLTDLKPSFCIPPRTARATASISGAR